MIHSRNALAGSQDSCRLKQVQQGVAMPWQHRKEYAETSLCNAARIVVSRSTSTSGLGCWAVQSSIISFI